MKTFQLKKKLSLLLVTAMTLSQLSVPAFAAGTTDVHRFKLAGGPGGDSFAGYRFGHRLLFLHHGGGGLRVRPERPSAIRR